MGWQTQRRLAQAAAQKAMERFTPPLEIAKAPIGFQVQALLEGAQPLMQAQA